MEKSKRPYWLGHRERLRRRAKAGGLEALRPHEILEMILGHVVPRMDLSGVARSLIEQFGSVEAVLSADARALQAVQGVTWRMAEWIMMTGELMNAYCDIRMRDQWRIWRYRDLIDFILPRRSAVRPPEIWVLYTGHDDCLLMAMKLGDALYRDDPRYSREIMEDALVLEARYVYLIGFVGTEDTSLWPEEVRQIANLGDLLSAIDVQLMDYVLVGENDITSMCMEGGWTQSRPAEATGALRERYLES